jgi:hypothetical protein
MVHSQSTLQRLHILKINLNEHLYNNNLLRNLDLTKSHESRYNWHIYHNLCKMVQTYFVNGADVVIGALGCDSYFEIIIFIVFNCHKFRFFSFVNCPKTK